MSTFEAVEMPPSQYEIAKEKIARALQQFKVAGVMIERFPCLLFSGCSFTEMTDVETRQILDLLLNLVSRLDQRRWTSMSPYVSKGDNKITYRGVCSRRGKPKFKLVKRNGRQSPKCGCKASFNLFSTGELHFKNGHVDDCLVDKELNNDGYVFNAGLSPSKKNSMILTVSDLLSDYGMTAAVAKKQIENALIKSGETGFGAGKSFLLLDF